MRLVRHLRPVISIARIALAAFCLLISEGMSQDERIPIKPDTIPIQDVEGENRGTDSGSDQSTAPNTNPLESEDTPPSNPGTNTENDADAEDLADVFVTASRGLRRDLDIPQPVSRVTSEDFARRGSTTVPDALSEEVGVLIQKTNQGGGSPIVRGRSGKDVLLLIDGQRFNNSIFRRNNQYLNTIDLAAVDRVEVVRGPASVLYGSDAMGGAINLLTRGITPTGENQMGGRLSLQHSTANNGWVSHASFEGEHGGFGFIGGVTFRDYRDLRAGRFTDPAGSIDVDGVQDPTGYRERDFSFGITRALSDTDTLEARVLYSRQYNVPRSDRLIGNDQRPDPPDLRRNFDPQRMRWYSLKYRHNNPSSSLESIEITASLNQPDEGRQRIRSSDPSELILERDQVFIPGLSAQATYRWQPDHALTAGADAYYEVINSRRDTVDLDTGERATEDFGRFPDDSRYRSFGVFAQDEWVINDSWSWTNGIRYSAFRVSLDLEGLEIDNLPPFGSLNETYDDFTFSTALTYRLSEETSVYGSIARGFRAPNLDDLAVVGDFASGERVPNLDLDPETVWNIETGIKHGNDTTRAGATVANAFYEDLFDIELLFTDSQGESVFQIENVSRARITTFELWGEHQLDKGLDSGLRKSIFGQLTWTLGRNTVDDEPVRRIPPPEAIVGYRVEELSERGLILEGFLRGALRQDRLSSGDVSDPRIPENGTPGWWTFNLRGGVDLDDGLRLNLALENIFDRRYRSHGSGIDAPGFGATIGLDWRF